MSVDDRSIFYKLNRQNTEFDEILNINLLDLLAIEYNLQRLHPQRLRTKKISISLI